MEKIGHAVKRNAKAKRNVKSFVKNTKKNAKFAYDMQQVFGKTVAKILFG